MDRKHDLNLAAICGIYCGDCPAYLSSRLEDGAEMENQAARKGLDLDEIQCDGCLSDRLTPDCQACSHGFRACALSHGVARCSECPELPCGRLREFSGQHVINGICHHQRVIHNLVEMKTKGIEHWLVEMDRKTRCPACGHPAYWLNRDCPRCGAGLR